MASNRPELLWNTVERLRSLDATIYAVTDAEESCVPADAADGVVPLCWKDGPEWMGRKSSCVKNIGIARAHQDGKELFWCVDDDLTGDFPAAFTEHMTRLSVPHETPPHGWISSIAWNEHLARGVPYSGRRQRTCALSCGLWTGSHDFDALTRLQFKDSEPKPWCFNGFVPSGTLFPVCGMNVAFRREIAGSMFFWPNVGRFDDIWMGRTAKRECDDRGLLAWCGTPYLHHERASDPVRSAAGEIRGIALNEVFTGTITPALDAWRQLIR